jgi:hypothetical protein
MPPVTPRINAVFPLAIALLRLVADGEESGPPEVPMELINMTMQLYNNV